METNFALLWKEMCLWMDTNFDLGWKEMCIRMERKFAFAMERNVPLDGNKL
jgi:hypothetical protein